MLKPNFTILPAHLFIQINDKDFFFAYVITVYNKIKIPEGK